jgi:hypothetical protein
MAEGISTAEVGKELDDHAHEQRPDGRGSRSERAITVAEALLLAVVAVLTAWSGYAAAKWGTESSLTLAQASAARTEASRADLAALETRNFDASTFDAWFTAYTAGNATAMDIAEQRFRPEFRVAFDAWLATDPASDADAPPGPTYMDEYRQPELERAAELDARADARYQEGAEAGTTGDDYVRTTIFLAAVLFLGGISGHFRLRGARYVLVGVGLAILAYSVTRLVELPNPPV